MFILMKIFHNMKTVQKMAFLTLITTIFTVQVGAVGVFFNHKAELALKKLYSIESANMDAVSKQSSQAIYEQVKKDNQNAY